MNTGSTSALLVLGRYGVQCDVPTHGKRFLDMLNDNTTDFLTIENPRFFNRENSTPVLQRASTMVRKNHLHMAVLTGEKTDGSRKLYFSTLQRRHFSATISLPTALIEGTIQTKAAVEPHSFVTIEASPFFAVTDVLIHHLTSMSEQMKSPVVFVHTDSITSLAFNESKTT